MKKKTFREKVTDTFSLNIVFILLLLLTILALPITVLLVKQNTQVIVDDTQVIVDPAKPGISISPAFDGLGFESSSLCNFINADYQGPALANLFSNLGQATMRFGGASVENTTWSSTGSPSCTFGNSTITPSLINDVITFARKINWKVIWGENLRNGDATNDANQAAYVVSSGGSTLSALEIGNEPDLYGLDYPTIKTKWETIANAVKSLTPSAPLTGPASCCRAGWLDNFIDDEASNLVFATYHLYPLGVNDSSQTITKMLDPNSMSNAAVTIDQAVAAASSHNLALQLDELNSIANGGTRGVSDVFASALWGADCLFTAAEHGAAGVNMFIGDGAQYDPISITSNPVYPKPLYYGMLLFHYVAGNGGHIVPVQVTSRQNVAAHGVLGSDGKLRVVIINKDQGNATTVQITTTQGYANAHAISLTAPSVTATSGITLGGSALASDGTWSPTHIQPIMVKGTTSSVSVPAASAVVLTYDTPVGRVTPITSAECAFPLRPWPAWLSGPPCDRWW